MQMESKSWQLKDKPIGQIVFLSKSLDQPIISWIIVLQARGGPSVTFTQFLAPVRVGIR